MSKTRLHTDNKQMTIFDHLNKLQHQTEKKDTSGTFACMARLQAAIRDAIGNSQFSVHQIAGEMSHLLDETITADVIYTWTRRSDELNGRPVRHIPAEYLPAFCHVVGDSTPIQIMGELAGVFVIPGPDALMAEIRKEEEVIREAKERKRRRELLLMELDKRNG